jgi:hypothetical protein
MHNVEITLSNGKVIEIKSKNVMAINRAIEDLANDKWIELVGGITINPAHVIFIVSKEVKDG